MALWTWVLIGLCAAGVILSVAAVPPVIAAGLALSSRLKQLRSSQLALSIESLQLQTNRLSNIAHQAGAVGERAKFATSEVKVSAEISGVNDAKAAMRRAGASISELLEDLD
jgi:hypothetical protein